MDKITLDTKLADIWDLPGMEPYYKYMLYTPHEIYKNSPFANGTVKDLGMIGWKPEGILAGLRFFLEKIDGGRVEQYRIYPGTDDPYKKDVNLIQISPETPDAGRPFIVLCAGGGYKSVCTLVESLPTAAHMVRAGYTVFLLTYRVDVPAAAVLALDDMAEAVKWLFGHARELGINPSLYAVGGWSAGANLVSNWGCANIGWKRFGAPKPLCMFPIYTVVDIKSEASRNENGGFARAMLGDAWREKLDSFNVVDHIDGDYPPCYIVCGRDDKVVPPVNSEMMKARLDAAGVPAVLEEGEHAFHGFGDGLDTDVEGWPERALAFTESLAKR